MDDTVDVGHQQLGLFNAQGACPRPDPRDVYETATSQPVAVLLRQGKTPSGDESPPPSAPSGATHRQSWPATRLTIGGDGHCGRPEVLAWCEANDLDFILDL